MDILKYFKKKEAPTTQDRQYFEYAPADIYPKTARKIIDVVRNHREVPNNLLLYLAEARRIVDYLELVNTPKNKCDENAIPLRARALELCRLWFTEELHASIGFAPMHLHITSDERYRL